jgi:hypothetical protein
MFLQAGDFAAPGAELISGSLLPGGRVDSQGIELRIDSQLSVLDLTRFLKARTVFCALVTSLFTIIYGVPQVPRPKRKKAPKGARFSR